MSALTQSPWHLVQPYPSTQQGPEENQQQWVQPTRKPPRRAELTGELYWQKLNEQLSPDGALKGLDGFYVIEDRSAVAYLIQENHLDALLLQALGPLESAFGDAIRSLSVVCDEDGFETLFCFVITPLPLQDARAALEAFDETWWLTRCGQASGKLN